MAQDYEKQLDEFDELDLKCALQGLKGTVQQAVAYTRHIKRKQEIWNAARRGVISTPELVKQLKQSLSQYELEVEELKRMN